MADADLDVSVIVAVRNGAATLEQCIDSVLGQEGCSIEFIIVDAMSDDGTQDIIESYGDRIAISIREPDGGISQAWNKALSIARGEWCLFLGADDYLLGSIALSALLACARGAPPGTVIAHGGIERIGGLEASRHHPAPNDLRTHISSGRMIPHQGALHSTAALRRAGGFDETFSIMGDADALLRLLHAGEGVRCPGTVAAMRIGGLSTSRDWQHVLAAERFRLMRRERGLVYATGFRMFYGSIQSLVQTLEQTVLLALGVGRGQRILVRARRLVRRPAKRY